MIETFGSPKMVDRVAKAIVDGLKLNTGIGPSERRLAVLALMALSDHWDCEMRFGDARKDISQACAAVLKKET